MLLFLPWNGALLLLRRVQVSFIDYCSITRSYGYRSRLRSQAQPSWLHVRNPEKLRGLGPVPPPGFGHSVWGTKLLGARGKELCAGYTCVERLAGLGLGLHGSCTSVSVVPHSPESHCAGWEHQGTTAVKQHF